MSKDTELAKAFRDAANRWAVMFATEGMPHPMPLSMYPDAWLRAEADRIEAEAEARAAERRDAGEKWLAGVCARHDIDPRTVLRDSVSQETSYKRMWKSRMEWPAGGTYEAAQPREFGDTIVATRTVSTVSMKVLGQDNRGRIEPHIDHVTTLLTFTDESPWVFEPARG